MPLPVIWIGHQELTIALKFDRDDADILPGEAYEKKGLYKQALETYKKAYALNPESQKPARKNTQIGN